MSGEWDRVERRVEPHQYEMRSIIREELQPIREDQAKIRLEQIEINEKIAQWEFGATIFRHFILATIGAIALGSSVWEWIKAHIK